jgi:hypothetical protein
MARRAAACAAARDDLLAAATALEHHGDEVRALLAEIARLQGAITDWVGSAVGGAADRADRAGETARSVADAMIEVDDYPPLGHQDWLELGRRIGERGVAL